MVIDFHVHAFPDGLAQKTIPLLAERSGLTAHADGTISMTLAKAKEASVTKIIHQNIATNPKQMAKVNDFAITTNQMDDIIAFGSIHPDASDYQDELKRLKEAGILGIKLHPDYQGFFIDEPKMQAVYETILKEDFILLFHAGLDLGLPEPIHASAEAIFHTLGLFSGEKVVLAHMGGFQMAEQVLDKIIGKDIYIDTSCASAYIENGLWKTMLKGHNPDKILFATDFPWGDFSTEINAIRDLDLSDELKEQILHKNAEALLSL